ncbi:MAG TPA: PQQ-dependent sugar dehydrogenase [Vicinamibacteria bacterium]|jgi:glucose/arabinose dehydrogenase
MCIRLGRTFVTLVVAGVVSPPRAPAQSIGLGTIAVKLEVFATGFSEEGQFAPTDLAPLGDGTGRLVVATLGGRFRLVSADGAALDTAAAPYFANAGSTIGTGGYGSTAVAVHPDFAANGRIYAIVTEAPSGVVDLPSPDGNDDHHDILVEWTADDPAADAPSFTRREVLRFGQPQRNHNVVDLAFGPDGFLYVSSGDGGSPNRFFFAQDPSNHHGTVMRIDPVSTSGPGIMASANGQYGIPTDNFGAQHAAALDEVYALGFRSPFRMDFDRLTGRLYLADVGESALEEVDLVTAGANYGWGRSEGTMLKNPAVALSPLSPVHQPPVFEYGREDGETVIGGFVYRGQALPALAGKYVFGDFGRQGLDTVPTPARLFYGDVDPATGDVTTVGELVLDPDGEALATRDDAGNLRTRQFVFSVGQDHEGELYLLVGNDPQFGGAQVPDGRVLKVARGSSDTAPALLSSSTCPTAPVTATLRSYGLTPGAMFVVVYGAVLEPFTVPAVSPFCAGTPGGGLRILGYSFLTADVDGTIDLTIANVPASSCGVYAQVFDIGRCAFSPVKQFGP